MKYYLILFFAFNFVASRLTAQTNGIYTIQLQGNQLELFEIDIENDSIRSKGPFSTTILQDINPKVHSFNYIDNHLIVAGWDENGDDAIYSIAVSDGSIVNNFYPGFIPFTAEFGNGKIYVFRYSAINLSLVEVDIDNGTAHTIAVYTENQLNELISEATTFDSDSNRIIVAGRNLAQENVVHVIDVGSGNIINTFNPDFLPAFLEYGNGKIYTLKPVNNEHELLEIDIEAGSETTIAVIDSLLLKDFNPDATSYDHFNNKLILAGWDGNNSGILISVDISNGDVVHSFLLPFDSNIAEVGGEIEVSPPIGIEYSVLNRGFDIFPNPASECFKINIMDGHGSIKNIRIFDSKGELMKNFITNEDLIKFDISGYNPGIYHVQVSLNAQVINKKIVKISSSE